MPNHSVSFTSISYSSPKEKNVQSDKNKFKHNKRHNGTITKDVRNDDVTDSFVYHVSSRKNVPNFKKFAELNEKMYNDQVVTLLRETPSKGVSRKKCKRSSLPDDREGTYGVEKFKNKRGDKIPIAGKRCSSPAYPLLFKEPENENKYETIEDESSNKPNLCKGCFRRSLKGPLLKVQPDTEDYAQSSGTQKPNTKSRKSNRVPTYEVEKYDLVQDESEDGTLPPSSRSYYKYDDSSIDPHTIDSVNFDYSQRTLTTKISNSKAISNGTNEGIFLGPSSVQDKRGGLKYKKKKEESFEDFTRHRCGGENLDKNIVVQTADEYKTSVSYRPCSKKEVQRVNESNNSNNDDNRLYYATKGEDDELYSEDDTEVIPKRGSSPNKCSKRKSTKVSQTKKAISPTFSIPQRIEESDIADYSENDGIDEAIRIPSPDIYQESTIPPPTQEGVRRKSIAMVKLDEVNEGVNIKSTPETAKDPDYTDDPKFYNEDAPTKSKARIEGCVKPSQTSAEKNKVEGGILKFNIENNRVSDIFDALKKDPETLDHMLAYRYVVEHFRDLGNHPEFGNMEERTLLSLLSEKSLQVPSDEKVLYDMLQRWVNNDPSSRAKVLSQIMSHVRFQVMGSVNLLKCFEELGRQASLEASSADVCQEWIRKAHWYKECKERGKEDVTLNTFFPPARRLSLSTSAEPGVCGNGTIPLRYSLNYMTCVGGQSTSPPPLFANYSMSNANFSSPYGNNQCFNLQQVPSMLINCDHTSNPLNFPLRSPIPMINSRQSPSPNILRYGPTPLPADQRISLVNPLITPFTRIIYPPATPPFPILNPMGSPFVRIPAPPTNRSVIMPNIGQNLIRFTRI